MSVLAKGIRVSDNSQPAGPAVAFRWAAAALLVLTVYGSLIPLHYTPRAADEAWAAFCGMTFFDPALLAARGDWVVSTALYAALSFAVMGAVARRGRGWLAALLVVPAGIALTFGVEYAQVYFPPRTVSVNDIVAESAGVAIGVLAWLAAGRRITDWGWRLVHASTPEGLASRLLPGYLVLLVCARLMPFDFVVGQVELETKWAEGKIRIPGLVANPEPIGHVAAKALLNFATFLPVGLLAAFAARRRKVHLPLLLAVPVATEVGQLFAYSRTADAIDIATGLAGVYAGWRLGPPLYARLRATTRTAPEALGGWWYALVAIWLAFVLYTAWQPFDFSIDPSAFASDASRIPRFGLRRVTLAPLVDYYWNSKYVALDLFVRKFLSFVPLGVLAALRLRDLYRRGATARLLVAAAALALVIEAGRYFLPSHQPSVTDVFVRCGGAWFGYALTRHARTVLWASGTLFDWLRKPPPPHRATWIEFTPDFQRDSSGRNAPSWPV